MKILFLTNIISPHQLPLAEALTRTLGRENYHYLYSEPLHDERAEMGWPNYLKTVNLQQTSLNNEQLLHGDFLFVTHHRAGKLFQKRNQLGKKTIFAGERWFGPPYGLLRIFWPRYFKMAVHFMRAVHSPHFHLFPIGIHAVRDFLRINALLKGDLRALFRAPKVAFESRPGGTIIPLEQAIEQSLLSQEEIDFGRQHGFTQIPKKNWGKALPSGFYRKLSLWGYFVKTSQTPQIKITNCNNVLWVGRFITCKRLKDLIQACKKLKLPLDIYGNGPLAKHLKKTAKNSPNITFNEFISLEKVREEMRKHRYYVLSSHGGEGWGVVINEALTEGVHVIGTLDAGGSATLLPPTHLYPASDIKRLCELLQSPFDPLPLEPWTIQEAHNVLLEKFKQLQSL